MHGIEFRRDSTFDSTSTIRSAIRSACSMFRRNRGLQHTRACRGHTTLTIRPARGRHRAAPGFRIMGLRSSPELRPENSEREPHRSSLHLSKRVSPEPSSRASPRVSPSRSVTDRPLNSVRAHAVSTTISPFSSPSSAPSAPSVQSSPDPPVPVPRPIPSVRPFLLTTTSSESRITRMCRRRSSRGASRLMDWAWKVWRRRVVGAWVRSGSSEGLAGVGGTQGNV
jgi:hypothetical protein